MKRNAIFVFFLAFELSVFSQQIPLKISDYQFINISENKIKIPADSVPLNNFFKKIDEVCNSQKGVVNIVHIGGSHIQAGIFSNQIRKNFDFYNGVLAATNGVFFPFKVAKTNNPTNFNVSYSGSWIAEKSVKRTCQMPLGVNGIAVMTSDAAAEISVKIFPNEEKHYDFDTLILWGQNVDKDMVMPIIRLDSNNFLFAEYDSLQQFYKFIFPQKTDTFNIIFCQTDTVPHNFILRGFLPKNSSQGIVYHSVGVNGATVPSYLGCEFFLSELSLFPPDLAIFGIGINDAVDVNFKPEKFIENYSALIAKIRSISPDCAFIFITNNDSYRRISRRKYAVNFNGAKVQKAFYELARQNNGGVWDQFEIMGGLCSMRKWQNAKLAKKDKIHFTPQGYILLGNLFFYAMDSYFQKQKFLY
ncbi:MAG: GDSL-type esterase/lipase family protein [Prevotellaceae bacterium]|jgi:lysophospholipase L1-like esterase|nr:GDSL-type esterase/lipase family protein [Prevotellaceae bacterium]